MEKMISIAQRKKYSKSFYINHTNKKIKTNINTFRQMKDNKNNKINNKEDKSSSQIKKKPFIKESPKTIDYKQVMNKYSLLMEQISDEKNTNLLFRDDISSNYNNIYNNTDINQRNDVLLEVTKKNEKEKCGYKSNTQKNFFQVGKINVPSKEKKAIKNIFSISKNINNNINSNLNKIHNQIYRGGNNQNIYSLKKYLKNKNASSSQGSTYSHSYNNINSSYNIKKGFSEESNFDIEKINYFVEKIQIIINLCQKYADSLNKLANTPNINDYLEEIKYIIFQYNKFMFSKKLKDIIRFNFHKDNNFDKSNYLKNFNFSEFEPKTLNLTEEFRVQINSLNEELKEFKNKNKELSLKIENLDIINQKLKKENNEFSIRQKEFKNIEKKCDEQNIIIYKLNCKIESLNSDIKYKENIINNLLKIIGETNKKNIDNKKISNSPNKNLDDFLQNLSNESIEKEIIPVSNINVSPIKNVDRSLNFEKFGKKIGESKKDYLQIKKELCSIKPIKSARAFSQDNETEKTSKQIEKIDKDIIFLKNKLNKIIAK